MNVALRRGMTVEEFLVWDEGQDGLWEFDGSRPVAMVGGTQAHSVISALLAPALITRLRGSPYLVHNASVAIHVAGSIRHPDAMVTRGPIAGASRAVDDPIVVFEVLSPSTAATDQTIKVAEYGATPSIPRYVILAQDRIAASVHERRGTEWSTRSITGPDAMLDCPELGIAFPLGELYAGVFAWT